MLEVKQERRNFSTGNTVFTCIIKMIKLILGLMDEIRSTTILFILLITCLNENQGKDIEFFIILLLNKFDSNYTIKTG